MCGINGLINSHQRSDIEMNLRKMNDFIMHRGPDQDGFFIENSQQFQLGMAMRRLSIIDLNNGKQPIFTDDFQKVIFFNGEIYNFNILKNDLEQKGVVFKTKSDTEVLIKLYEYYDVHAFSMLDGMFAFSIYDKTKNKVFIARDFFGEKPLYYTKTNEYFIWASELKSIINTLPTHPPINTTALNIYFQLSYIPAPYTIYDSIFKLEANHYIEFDCTNFSFQIHKIEQNFKTYPELSKRNAIKIAHDLVQESVFSRTIADVPLGSFLSGGVDSSIISLCMARQSSSKIDTFSIGFEKKSFDETYKSRLVAKLIGSNHHEFIISEEQMTKNFDNIILNFDEPFADSSAIASYVVSARTKEYVKVALTGDGGDEVFGGYNKYYMGKLNEKYISFIPHFLHKKLALTFENLLSTKDDKRGYRFKISRLLKSINYEGDYYYNIISLGFQDYEVKEILNDYLYKPNSLMHFKKKINNQSKTLTDFRNIDKIISLEGDMLVKVDRTSMLTSLECRSPFLNKEIWNFTNQIPENLLINNWDKKFLLKAAFQAYFPNNFLNKSKKGFAVPVGDLLRSKFSTELISYIDKSFIKTQNIFQYENISSIVLNHLDGKLDNSFRVWTFFCFQKWYKNNFK
jgi:asparagine synthase (glutamine-hydrolysing)